MLVEFEFRVVNVRYCVEGICNMWVEVGIKDGDTYGPPARSYV